MLPLSSAYTKKLSVYVWATFKKGDGLPFNIFAAGGWFPQYKMTSKNLFKKKTEPLGRVQHNCLPVCKLQVH